MMSYRELVKSDLKLVGCLLWMAIVVVRLCEFSNLALFCCGFNLASPFFVDCLSEMVWDSLSLVLQYFAVRYAFTGFNYLVSGLNARHYALVNGLNQALIHPDSLKG